MNQAVKYLQLAADQGYADAQSNMGDCYSNGEGMTKYFHQAVKYSWSLSFRSRFEISIWIISLK